MTATDTMPASSVECPPLIAQHLSNDIEMQASTTAAAVSVVSLAEAVARPPTTARDDAVDSGEPSDTASQSGARPQQTSALIPAPTLTAALSAISLVLTNVSFGALTTAEWNAQPYLAWATAAYSSGAVVTLLWQGAIRLATAIGRRTILSHLQDTELVVQAAACVCLCLGTLLMAWSIVTMENQSTHPAGYLAFAIMLAAFLAAVLYAAPLLVRYLARILSACLRLGLVLAGSCMTRVGKRMRIAILASKGQRTLARAAPRPNESEGYANGDGNGTLAHVGVRADAERDPANLV